MTKEREERMSYVLEFTEAAVFAAVRAATMLFTVVPGPAVIPCKQIGLASL